MTTVASDNHYENVHALGDSQHMFHKHMYDSFIELLDKIFGTHTGTLRIDETIETPENIKFIEADWVSLKLYFQIPSTIKSVKKIVRQTLKYLVEYFNQNHLFTLESKIKFEHARKTVRVGTGFKAYSFTLLEL